MIRKTNQTVLTWKRFLKSLPKENTNCISFIKIIMPDEFAFALQPVLVLGQAEPGKIPDERTEKEKETDSVKAVPDEKEVILFNIRVGPLYWLADISGSYLYPYVSANILNIGQIIGIYRLKHGLSVKYWPNEILVSVVAANILV